MSRREADLIAVLIFTTIPPLVLIRSGGTAFWDKSRLRVPHSSPLVAERPHFHSALLGGRIDFDPLNTDVCRKPSEFFNPH